MVCIEDQTSIIQSGERMITTPHLREALKSIIENSHQCGIMILQDNLSLKFALQEKKITASYDQSL